MNITEKLNRKKSLREFPSVTIAFLGDSVTQGCFDCYIDENGNIETKFDYANAYSTRVKEYLNILYPQVQVNIINSGISGDNAAGGLGRIERDVLSFLPDLTVVSFGLNDSMSGINGLDSYTENLEKIFGILKENNSEIIFLSQNFMNTKVSCHLKDEKLRNCAKDTMRIQNEGILKAYMNAAIGVAKNFDVKVIDSYSMWAAMDGENVKRAPQNSLKKFFDPQKLGIYGCSHGSP